jgi:hypothetical protein
MGSLATCTAYSRTLTALNFSDTCCGSGGDDAHKGNNEGVVALANSLRFVNRTLTHIDLRHNSMSRTAVECLARAFVTNKALTYMNLSDCRLQPPAVGFLVRCASLNPVLALLDLSGNPRLCCPDANLDAIPHIVDRCYPDDHAGDPDPALENTQCDAVALLAMERRLEGVRDRLAQLMLDTQAARDDATFTHAMVEELERLTEHATGELARLTHEHGAFGRWRGLFRRRCGLVRVDLRGSGVPPHLARRFRVAAERKAEKTGRAMAVRVDGRARTLPPSSRDPWDANFVATPRSSYTMGKSEARDAAARAAARRARQGL